MGHHSVLSFPQEHTPEPNPKIIIMNPMFAATLAVVALSVADATIIIGTTAAAGTAVTISAASATSLALLGAAVARRGKRSAESSDDAAFTILTNSEPAQCYRRLVCDMAAGAIPDEGKILSLFNKDVSPVSPKFDYVSAAKVGKLVKNAALCEVRYTCPLSTQEIAKLF